MNIAIYGSHDGSITINKDGKYRVFECEKFNGKRHSAFTQMYGQLPSPTDEEYEEYLQFVKVNLEYIPDYCFYNQLFNKDFERIQQVLGVNIFVKYDHHDAHAAGAFFQSPFNDAVVISFDGGGENLDGTYSSFNIYRGKKDERRFDLIHRSTLDLGTPYLRCAIPLSIIRKRNYDDTLPLSGKLMGLAAYGQFVKAWEDGFRNAFLENNITHISKCIGIDMRQLDIISDKEISVNIAYMAQHTFENLFFHEIDSFLKDNLPVCLSGGCALNVLCNQKLYKKCNGRLYIPPNPNDCGLSFGAMVLHDFPMTPQNIVYNGYDILDRPLIRGYPINVAELSSLLMSGNIVGFMQGSCEIGPRALGNRSILCDPTIKNIKKTLNDNIKFREWFRPFAAVVRNQDVNEYFEFDRESPYMSLCPVVKPKYREALASVTHIDNTCRIQTVSKTDNKHLYELLTEHKHNGGGVLLNTSLNTKGAAIINKVVDAYNMCDTTPLHGIWVEGTYYEGRPAI